MSGITPEADPDWLELIQTRLLPALNLISEYSQASGRLGLHDLVALETLRGMPERLVHTPEEALEIMLSRGETVFIGGPKGYVWEQFDEDLLSVLAAFNEVKPDTEDEDEEDV